MSRLRKRSGRGGALAILLLTGCGATPTPPAPVVLPPPAPVPVAAPVVAVAEPTPPGLDPPGELGCTFPTTRRLPLRFRAGAPPFASLQGASALAGLRTAGPAAGASVTAVREGFTLAGVVAADDISLAPTRAMVIAGFLIPTDWAHFSWQGTSAGRVTVGVSLAPHVAVLPEAHLDTPTTLPCDAVALADTTFDALSAAPRSPNPHDATLRVGKAVPLSRTPGGPPVAMLQAESAADDGITVVETRGRHALVVLQPGPDVVLFGWVPRAEVLPVTREWARDTYSNGIGLVDPRRAAVRAVVRCDHELALVAEVAGERRTVGSVAAGTALRLGEEREAIVPVVLPETLATAVGDAQLGVLASHLAGCERGQ